MFYLYVLSLLCEVLTIKCDALIVRNLPVQPARYLTFSKVRLDKLQRNTAQQQQAREKKELEIRGGFFILGILIWPRFKVSGDHYRFKVISFCHLEEYCFK